MCYFSKIMKFKKKSQNCDFLHYYQNGDRPFNCYNLWLFVLLLKCIPNAYSKMQDLHGVFTARTRRAHNALEDPTAFQQRAV